MSIRGQVEDAIFLAENGRYIGALTILMLAIAASSKRVFPPGTKSLQNPKKPMPDQESFTLFLGGRLRQILIGFRGFPDICNSGISLMFRGEPTDLTVLIYKYYRNALVHQGVLENDVEFVTTIEDGLKIGDGLNLNIAAGGRLTLEPRWLHVFIEAVIYAVCNAAEFGITHRRMIISDGTDEKQVRSEFTQKYTITEARYEFFKHIVEMLWEPLQQESDENLNHEFAKLVPTGQVNPGGISLLQRDGFATAEGVLSRRGIECVREIAVRYKIVVYS